MNKFLTDTLYCYVERTNATHARHRGGSTFGTFSNYVNFLIAKDAGDKASMKRSMEYAKECYEPTQKVVKKAVKKTKRSVKVKKAAARAKIKAIRSVPMVTHSAQAA